MEDQPLENGTVEASPAAVAAQEDALIRSGVKKKPADRTPEETKAVRKYQREKQKGTRARVEARQGVSNRTPNSDTEMRAAIKLAQLACTGGLDMPFLQEEVFPQLDNWLWGYRLEGDGTE